MVLLLEDNARDRTDVAMPPIRSSLWWDTRSREAGEGVAEGEYWVLVRPDQDSNVCRKDYTAIPIRESG